ncbi:MAG: RNA-guided endonuclease TnpB family protein, partial [Gloeotrichia echinulata HAB0833]
KQFNRLSLIIKHAIHARAINADCNGAANVARKVAATLGKDLAGVSRGALSTPLRVHFWTP